MMLEHNAHTAGMNSARGYKWDSMVPLLLPRNLNLSALFPFKQSITRGRTGYMVCHRRNGAIHITNSQYQYATERKYCRRNYAAAPTRGQLAGAAISDPTLIMRKP